MSEAAAAKLAELSAKNNPANTGPRRVTDATRVPMTLPTLKLAVPEKPGFVREWFLDRAGQINKCLAAGYEFVRPEELSVHNTGVGSDPATDGNTDLGSRVSLHGGVGERGQAERLYLMEIKQEWWDADRKVLADRNESIAATIRGGQVGTDKDAPEDRGQRYGGQKELPSQTDGPPRVRRVVGKNMFTPK